MAKPVVTFEWKGLDQMKKTLHEIGVGTDATKAEVKDLILPSAIKMRDNARSLAPKRTGALAEAIYARRAGKKGPGVLVGVRRKISLKDIGPLMPDQKRGKTKFSTFYGRFIEFGTSKMAARPFFRPAFLTTSSTYVQDMAPRIMQLIDKLAKEFAEQSPK